MRPAEDSPARRPRLRRGPLDEDEFRAEVRQVLDSLPADFSKAIRNVQVLVEDRPSPQLLREIGSGPGRSLLGLYVGVPLTERSCFGVSPVPDRIILFRLPLIAACRNRAQLRREIRRTLLHELAHYFGIDDDRLRELGAY